MLKTDDLAPEISLPDQEGKIHSLSDYKGKKLLVFFYPESRKYKQDYISLLKQNKISLDKECYFFLH